MPPPYGYDALNRLVKDGRPDGRRDRYAYDALDHLTAVTDPRGLKTSYGWNALDDQTGGGEPGQRRDRADLRRRRQRR